MQNPRQKHVVVIGAGTFGLSTALWLLRQNYKNVTIVDPYQFPSDISAGNDINKIIETAFIASRSMTNTLAMEALEGWQTDPVFYPHYNETGIVYATSQGKKSSEYEELMNVVTTGNKKHRKYTMEWLDSPEDYKKLVPQLSGPLVNWKGYYQREECGWAHAKNSLISAGKEIERLGGKFVWGEVETLLYNDENNKVIGCKTKKGKIISGDTFVISAGASSVKLLDFKDQLLAKCWTLGHIKLTPEEAKKFRGLPVICNIEKGFFFEPDFVKNEMKIVNEFPGYTHFKSDSSKPNSSIPIKKNQIPKAARDDIKKLLEDTIPEFASRPLVETKICWCTDTPDRNFLIDEHPNYGDSLILATGDSGHGFKHMPNIGKYIARLITYGPASLDDEKRNKWRWRPETAKDRKEERFGGDGNIYDLGQITEWVGPEA